MSDQALVVRDQNQPLTRMEQGGVIRLADKLDSVVESFKEYTKACEALLTKDDYQSIANRSFKKKSAWRKIATAFGVSTKIISSKIEYDEDDRIHHAEFIVEAFAPNGRSAQAWAGASRVDRDFSHDQDVAATAQTRATNRAIADLIGCGEVSAEEMLDEKQQNRREATKPAKAAPASQSATGETQILPCCSVKAVKEVHSKPDAPKKWTAYFISFNDGAGDLEAATFDTRIADFARQLADTGDDAKITVKPGRKPGSKEIVGLEYAGPPTAPAEDNVPMEFDDKGQPVGVTP